MLLSDFKKISIDGVEMKQLFINDTQVWKSGYKNWVKYSTENDGKTIYNGGLGYKTGYRVRSGGAEGENSYAICTGFIPYKKGDLLRIIPQFTGVNSQNTINFYDSGFANLGQYNDNGSFYGICTGGGWNVATEQDGITTVDVTGANGAAGIAYIRITHIYVAPGRTTGYTAYVQDPETDFIVTVNEEIEIEPTNFADPTSADWATDYRLSTSKGTPSPGVVGHTVTNFIPAKMVDVLLVKGLSITEYVSNNFTLICAYKADKTYQSKLAVTGTSGGSSADGARNQVTVSGDISTYTILMDDAGTQRATSETAYIRIDGVLMDGYTKDDVVINIKRHGVYL